MTTVGEVVPIAERMRQRKRRKITEREENSTIMAQGTKWQQRGGTQRTADSATKTIDDEIKRLEDELADNSSTSGSENESDGGSNSDSDSSCSSDDESAIEVSKEDGEGLNFSSRKGQGSFGKKNSGKEQNMSATGSKEEVICLSKVSSERIQPLPIHALPQNKRRKMKIDLLYTEQEAKHSRQQESGQHNIDGLRDAVKEVLDGYVSRSQREKPLPFYCRVCDHQSKDEKEFFQHRSSTRHKLFVKEEQKATYCNACRKQLTSILQMNEHLKSRPHRERMAFLATKQQGRGRRGRDGGEGKEKQKSTSVWRMDRQGRTTNKNFFSSSFAPKGKMKRMTK